jgi:hypothetical protein
MSLCQVAQAWQDVHREEIIFNLQYTLQQHLMHNDLLLHTISSVAAPRGTYIAVHTAATWPRLSLRFKTKRVSSAVNVWHEAANTTEAVAAPQYMNPTPQRTNTLADIPPSRRGAENPHKVKADADDVLAYTM